MMPAWQKKRVTGLISLFLLSSGCGGVIGELENLPQIEVSEQTPWPLLIDTPAPPESRLTSGAGDAAKILLEEQLVASSQRQQSVSLAPAISDAFVQRAPAAIDRRPAANPEIDESVLLARAEEARQRMENPQNINESSLVARAERSRQRTATPASFPDGKTGASPPGPQPLRPLDIPVLSPDFEERARKALERAAQANNS